ncbi:MAG: hypothetical protein M3137_19295 [Actinomycetota bacterium]|nr:hypothetical protein [Actinomycetota bacterium]
MAETNPPKGDRVGNDYHQGTNPNPGGDLDTGKAAVPPYEGRNDGTDERQATGTARAFGSEPPEHEPVQPGSDAEQPASTMAPDNVGESINRRGEDVAKQDGKEAGRHEEGTDDSREADRPVGTSDNRDQTGI